MDIEEQIHDVTFSEAFGTNPDFVPEVTSPDQARKAIAAIRFIKRTQDPDIDRLTFEMNRIKMMLDERVRIRDEAIEKWELSLRGWHRAHFALDEVGQTFRTGFGESTIKAAGPVAVVNDEEAFLAWAKEHRPDFVKVTVSAIKKDIKAACKNLIEAELPSDASKAQSVGAITDDGEKIPGVTIERGESVHNYTIDMMTEPKAGDDE